MSKPDPLDPKNATKSRFEISDDELNARMKRQEKIHDEPLREATATIGKAICIVLAKLGVNCEMDNIPDQQAELGIRIISEERPDMFGLNGYYVMVARGGDLHPYAWIGDARLDSNGNVWCDICWIKEHRLESIGGTKVVG